MRLEEGNDCNTVTAVMISAEAGEKIYDQLKEFTFGKFHVSLRPHASEFSLFASGIKKNISEE